MQGPSGIETARLLPPAAATAPFSLHLVLDASGSGGARGPWMRLSEADDVARVYLAAVKGDEDTLLELCALKLLPDAWPEGAAASAFGTTNGDLEDRWKRENARLVELRALSPRFPRLVSLDSSAGDFASRLPPLFYSRPGRSFFVPPCPRCRAPLSLCRDEAWLAQANLPPFATTRERFLWCESGAKVPEPCPVYTTSQLRAPGPGVRSAADLLDDLGRALRESWTEDEAASLVGAATAAAVRSLPASGAESVRDLIAPLTFYGSPYVLTVAAPLDLEALADALGGKPAEEPPQRSPGEAGFPPRRAWLGRSGAPTRQLLFPAESSGLDAVEVLFLKLTAFRQVLEGLIDYYRATGRPHLDLHPRHLLFELSGAGDGLPVFWTLQARIHGLAAAAVSLPAPGSPTVLLPGDGLAVPYAAPEVQEFRLAGHRPGELVFTDLDEEGTAARRFRLRGRLADPYGLYPAPGPRETIFLSLPDPALGFGFTGLAVRATAGEIRSDETAFASDLLDLDAGSLRRLRVAVGTKLPGARYRVFPDFGTPADLHALGVSLLRLLLRNDDQDLAAVLKAVDRLSREVAAWPPDARRDVTLAALLKRAPDAAPAFSKTQLLWGRDDRRAGRPNAVPEALWDRALLLALRLVTRVAGFSVAAGPADFDPLFREEKLERILPEIVGILAELGALLFGRQPLHVEIQQVLAEIREEEFSSGARP